MFLDKGEIVSTKGRNTQPRHYEAQKDSPFENSDIPMVAMVNQNSASASGRRAAPGPQKGRRCRPAFLRQGLGAEPDRSRRRQQHPQADCGELLSAVWREHSPFKNAKTTDKWGVSPDPAWRSSSHREFVNWFIARANATGAGLSKGHRKAEEPAKTGENSEDKKAQQKPAQKTADDKDCG